MGRPKEFHQVNAVFYSFPDAVSIGAGPENAHVGGEPCGEPEEVQHRFGAMQRDFHEGMHSAHATHLKRELRGDEGARVGTFSMCFMFKYILTSRWPPQRGANRSGDPQRHMTVVL